MPETRYLFEIIDLSERPNFEAEFPNQASLLHELERVNVLKRVEYRKHMIYGVLNPPLLFINVETGSTIIKNWKMREQNSIIKRFLSMSYLIRLVT